MDMMLLIIFVAFVIFVVKTLSLSHPGSHYSP